MQCVRPVCENALATAVWSHDVCRALKQLVQAWLVAFVAGLLLCSGQGSDQTDAKGSHSMEPALVFA